MVKIAFLNKSGGTNYWERVGTILSPSTNGDTVQVGAGSVAQPGYAFEGAANYGIYYNAGLGRVQFAAGGVDVGYFSTTEWTFNPGNLSNLYFTVNSDNDILLQTEPSGDNLFIGRNEFPSPSAGNFKTNIYYGGQTLGHENYGGINLEHIFVGATGSIINYDLRNYFSWQQTSSAKIFTRPNIFQELNYDVNGGDITNHQAAHQIDLKLLSTGSGTHTWTDYEAIRYRLDNDLGAFTQMFGVSFFGGIDYRYNGRGAIATGATVALPAPSPAQILPDNMAITFANPYPDTGYTVNVTSSKAVRSLTFTLGKGKGVVTATCHVDATIDESAKTTAGFTAYFHYTFVFTATGAVIAEGDNLPVVLAAADAALEAYVLGLGGIPGVYVWDDADYALADWQSFRY